MEESPGKRRPGRSRVSGIGGGENRFCLLAQPARAAGGCRDGTGGRAGGISHKSGGLGLDGMGIGICGRRGGGVGGGVWVYVFLPLSGCGPNWESVMHEYSTPTYPIGLLDDKTVRLPALDFSFLFPNEPQKNLYTL
jgi:hypothetical protein